ncbi:hypothetical protein BDW62DRAFT_202390 [Aspergillus aurantiobrunneus]
MDSNRRPAQPSTSPDLNESESPRDGSRTPPPIPSEIYPPSDADNRWPMSSGGSSTYWDRAKVSVPTRSGQVVISRQTCDEIDHLISSGELWADSDNQLGDTQGDGSGYPDFAIPQWPNSRINRPTSTGSFGANSYDLPPGDEGNIGEYKTTSGQALRSQQVDDNTDQPTPTGEPGAKTDDQFVENEDDIGGDSARRTVPFQLRIVRQAPRGIRRVPIPRDLTGRDITTYADWAAGTYTARHEPGYDYRGLPTGYPSPFQRSGQADTETATSTAPGKTNETRSRGTWESPQRGVGTGTPRHTSGHSDESSPYTPGLQHTLQPSDPVQEETTERTSAEAPIPEYWTQGHSPVSQYTWGSLDQSDTPVNICEHSSPYSRESSYYTRGFQFMGTEQIYHDPSVFHSTESTPSLPQSHGQDAGSHLDFWEWEAARFVIPPDVMARLTSGFPGASVSGSSYQPALPTTLPSQASTGVLSTAGSLQEPSSPQTSLPSSRESQWVYREGEWLLESVETEDAQLE